MATAFKVTDELVEVFTEAFIAYDGGGDPATRAGLEAVSAAL